MNTEQAQAVLNEKVKALRAEADAYELAANVLLGKYEGELVSLPALVQDNADKVISIAALTSAKATLESEKASLITEKEGLQSTVALKDAKIADLQKIAIK